MHSTLATAAAGVWPTLTRRRIHLLLQLKDQTLWGVRRRHAGVAPATTVPVHARPASVAERTLRRLGLRGVVLYEGCSEVCFTAGLIEHLAVCVLADSQPDDVTPGLAPLDLDLLSPYVGRALRAFELVAVRFTACHASFLSELTRWVSNSVAARETVTLRAVHRASGQRTVHEYLTRAGRVWLKRNEGPAGSQEPRVLGLLGPHLEGRVPVVLQRDMSSSRWLLSDLVPGSRPARSTAEDLRLVLETLLRCYRMGQTVLGSTSALVPPVPWTQVGVVARDVLAAAMEEHRAGRVDQAVLTAAAKIESAIERMRALPPSGLIHGDPGPSNVLVADSASILDWDRVYAGDLRLLAGMLVACFGLGSTDCSLAWYRTLLNESGVQLRDDQLEAAVIAAVAIRAAANLAAYHDLQANGELLTPLAGISRLIGGRLMTAMATIDPDVRRLVDVHE